MANDIIEKMKEVFAEKELTYYCKEEGGRVGAILSKGALFFDLYPNIVECQYVLKRKIPMEQCDQVMEYINHINMTLREGHVEIDREGVVRCRLTADISDGQEISKGRLEAMLIRAMRTELRYSKDLYEIAEGGENRREYNNQ